MLSFNFRTVKVKEISPWMEWCSFLSPSICWHLASRMFAGMSLKLVQEESQSQTLMPQTLLNVVSLYKSSTFFPASWRLQLMRDNSNLEFWTLSVGFLLFCHPFCIVRIKNSSSLIECTKKSLRLFFTFWCPSFYFIIKIN